MLDVTCPVEWGHPLNVGLAGCWMVPPNPGWWGGATLRDLVRGGKKPSDGTLTNMAFPATSTSGWAGPRGRQGGRGSLAFDGTDDYVHVPASASYPLTISLWALATSLSGFPACFSVGQASNNNDRHVVYVSSGGSSFFAAQSRSNVPAQGDAVHGRALTAGVWYHVAAVFASATSRTIYVNGGGGVTNTTSVTPGSLDRMAIGRIAVATPSLYWPGLVDDVRLYRLALSGGEVSALYDQSRRGHPDTLRWVSTRAWFVPAAAGTTTQNLAGTAAASAALARAGAKPLAGSLGGSGALARSDAKGLTGSQGAAATLTRLCGRAIAGAQGVSAAVAKLAGQALAATQAAGAALAKAAARALAAAQGSSGSYDAVRAVLLALAGAQSAAATLGKAAGKAAAATQGLAAAVANATFKAMTGGAQGLAAAFATLRAALLTLAGAQGASSSLARLAAKGLSGAQSAASALGKLAGKAWAVVQGLAAALTRSSSGGAPRGAKLTVRVNLLGSRVDAARLARTRTDRVDFGS